MTSLCRNKTPGLFDSMKNAATEKVMIISQKDNTSIVHKTPLNNTSFSFICNAFHCNENTELNGTDI